MVVSAGQRITAGMFPATKSARQDAAVDFTSTSFTETSTSNPFPSTTFVAPTSGEVTVSLTAWLENSGAARTYLTYIIREGAVVGSGTTFFTGGDENSIVNNVAGDDDRDGIQEHITGLTPGATYNLRTRGRVGASAGKILWQHVIVRPCY